MAQDPPNGPSELTAAWKESRPLMGIVLIFSIVLNLLMLTGPLYMLQVYDRVLGSRSEATLVALTLLIAVLFLAMGVLEFARGRVLAVAAARFQGRLDRRVFQAAMARTALMPNDPAALSAQRDLEAVQRFVASPLLTAVLDIPWTPLFVAAIFLFHPLLGWLAIVGGALLVLVTWLNQRQTRRPQAEAGSMAARSERMADQLKSEAEVLRAMGMASAGFARWKGARTLALQRNLEAGASTGLFSSFSKTFRQFLQSAMLGLGAWLVLRGELSAGVMIAGSILLGRALAPIETAIGQWALGQRALEGWRRLGQLLSTVPPEPQRTALPRPKARIRVENVTVVPPGETVSTLRLLSFEVQPGEAVGVIGPSGSGKSTLARALCGIWQPVSGRVRLDGAALDQYDPDRLGACIGYLPQRVTLFDGTIAENIARLEPNPDGDKIVEAARKAAVHDMIISLPMGYETQVTSGGGRLSGGQIQRIGLARALYGDPVVLVLDEPNSNLDSDGSISLNRAIRAMKAAGRTVFIMAHRPAAIQECDQLLFLENGMKRAFGPREQVLHDMVRNQADIRRSDLQGAGK